MTEVPALPIANPGESTGGPRALRGITVAAIAFVWFPILNVVLAHSAELAAETSGETNARVALWVKVAAYAVTAIVIMVFLWFLGGITRESDAWNNGPSPTGLP